MTTVVSYNLVKKVFAQLSEILWCIATFSRHRLSLDKMHITKQQISPLSGQV